MGETQLEQPVDIRVGALHVILAGVVEVIDRDHGGDVRAPGQGDACGIERGAVLEQEVEPGGVFAGIQLPAGKCEYFMNTFPKSSYTSIEDIAKAAGVSHATVSRALQSCDLVRPETAQRSEDTESQDVVLPPDLLTSR
jgi:hypothetical protein